jgi:hypothetical protein
MNSNMQMRPLLQKGSKWWLIPLINNQLLKYKNTTHWSKVLGKHTPWSLQSLFIVPEWFPDPPTFSLVFWPTSGTLKKSIPKLVTNPFLPKDSPWRDFDEKYYYKTLLKVPPHGIQNTEREVSSNQSFLTKRYLHSKCIFTLTIPYGDLVLHAPMLTFYLP